MQLELNSTGLARLGRTATGVYLGILLAACGGGGDASIQALDTVTLELSMLPWSQAVVTQVAQPMVLVSGAVVVEPLANAYDSPTYSPAQVRSAYDMAALPDWRNALTPAQSASLGAGQTVYLINAYHNSQIAQELAAFNDRFGLPPCRVTRMAPSESLPLPPASASGCELLLVASTSAGDISADIPGYASAWASEAALDVQWAHATAPLARLVLIEAPNAALSSMQGAIKLANQMGPGVVSMSFGLSPHRPCAQKYDEQSVLAWKRCFAIE
jgi:subtilase family serine protease